MRGLPPVRNVDPRWRIQKVVGADKRSANHCVYGINIVQVDIFFWTAQVCCFLFLFGLCLFVLSSQKHGNALMLHGNCDMIKPVSMKTVRVKAAQSIRCSVIRMRLAEKERLAGYLNVVICNALIRREALKTLNPAGSLCSPLLAFPSASQHGKENKRRIVVTGFITGSPHLGEAGGGIREYGMRTRVP